MKANRRIILLALAGAMVGAVGLSLAWRQTRWRHTFSKIPAKIVESRMVESHLGGYRSAISYAYQVENKRYTAARFAPLPVFGSVGWARRMKQAHPVGQAVSVYVNPAQPGEAYLRQTSLFYPHGLVLLGWTMLVGAAVMAHRRACRKQPPRSLATDSTNWHGHRSRSIPMTEAALDLLAALSYLGLCGATMAHYRTALGPGYDRLGWFGLAFVIAGLIWLGLSIRKIRAASPFDIACIETTLARAYLDAPILTRVSLPVRSSVYVHQVRLNLVCWRTDGSRSFRVFTHGQTLAEAQRLSGGQSLKAEVGFEVPQNKRRASQAGPSSQIHWQFELHIRRPRTADVVMRFPIEAARRSQEPQSEHVESVALASPPQAKAA